MAILGKIRSRGTLLLIVVGFALFAFIIGDFLTQGSTYFSKSREKVAEIEGDDVNIKDYQAAIDQMIEVYKIETGQSELNEELTSQLRASVWDNLLTEKLLFAEAKKIKLTISEDELSDYLIGNNIHPLIAQRRAFSDENGQFSRAALLQFLSYLDITPQSQQELEQIKQFKSYWMFWENNVKMSVLQEKYIALMGKAVTANSLDAKYAFEASKVTADVNYVVQPYYLLPDSAVSISKNEIKAYYDKHKDLYKEEANRILSYVVFDVEPLKEDSVEAQTWMDNLAEEFTTTDDVAGLVNSNSDVMYDGRNYSYDNIPVQLRDFAFSGKAGEIYGPVFVNNTHTMARLMETGIMQSDSVKLRHIYLTAADASKTDSIVNAIKGGASFADLAKKYSAVQGTAANGGEIGWIVQNVQGLDKEMLEKSFSSAVNQVFTVKDAQQGVQIMQVTEKTPARSKVKVAILERKVVASSRSYSRIYNEAKQFAAELKNDKFNQRAEEKGLYVRMTPDLFETTENIANMPNTRQVVRWAFENKKGSVSDVFDCNSHFVVATVQDVNEKGYRSVDKVSEQIKSELIREKKGDVLVKEFAEKLKANGSLDALAQSISAEVKVAEAVNFSQNQFGGAGFEPAVIGKASVTANGAVSSPVKGNAGVYVLQPNNAQVSELPFDLQSQIMQLNMNYAYSVPYMILQDNRQNAKIEDYRLRFF